MVVCLGIYKNAYIFSCNILITIIFRKNFFKKIFYYLSLIIICIIVRKFAPYPPVFLIGILFAKHHLFEKLDSIISNQMFSIIFSFILLSIVLFLRSAEIVHMNSDFVIIPFFIYSIINLKHKCNFFNISNLLIKLNKYSIYMWLIHTFFAKYYLQQFILLPKYTILIFILSLISSILIDKLYTYIQCKYTLNSNFISKYYYQIYLIFSFILWINFIVLFIQSYTKYLI